MKITKRQFIKWLSQQNDDREFRYSSCTNCIFASFLKETKITDDPIVGGYTFSLYCGISASNYPLPKWFKSVIKGDTSYDKPTYTAKELKRAFKE